MRFSLDTVATDEIFDVAVIGAGAAGLSAALFAALRGAKVLVLERTEFVGGTSAFSAGTTWIPNNPHAASVGAKDSYEAAAGFLRRAVGNRSSEAMREAFLAAGPLAVAELEAKTEVRYRARPLHPDYLSELEGSTLKGRALEPLAFDGRRLGPLFKLIRPPIPEFTVAGGMMVDRDDVGHLLNVTRSFASLRHAARLLARHALDRLRYERGTRLVMGNALIARLLYSLSRHDVTLLTRADLVDIEAPGRAVSALALRQGGTLRRLGVRRGVILASGGFNRHPQRRRDKLGLEHDNWCPGAPGHKGAAHDFALGLGARYGEGALSDAYWAPVSTRRRPDGTTAVFPHFLLDRGKPGMITVDQSGRRFVNESTSYHLFVLAMRARGSAAVPSYLITDEEGLQRYGMGIVRPGGRRLAPFLADGYLTRGASLAELAGHLDIDAAALEATVERFNAMAEAGIDEDFERGSTDYQRANGDPSRGGRNPCLGRVEKPPFYAVRLYPGDIGAATGLVTDTDARVLGPDDRPIPGLYACGNDMHSVMGGIYPGPGITLGPGLAFAWLAARHAMTREV